MPQMRQAVYANPARSNAPPTPPTTPPMIAFDELERPPLDEELDPDTAEGGRREEVATGTCVVLVRVPVTVLPPCTEVYVSTT